MIMNSGEILFFISEYHPLTKRKSSNSTEPKSCLKVLCDNYLKNQGWMDAVRDKKKVVILRISKSATFYNSNV